MSSLNVKVGSAFKNLKERGQRSLRMKTANLVLAAMNAATKVALESTPVWMGETMANYRWSFDYPDTTSVVQFRNHSKIDGDWWLGSTDTLSASDFSGEMLGEVALKRSAIFSNPFRKLYFTNNVQYEDGMGFADLESGALTGTPHPISAEITRVVQEKLRWN